MAVAAGAKGSVSLTMRHRAAIYIDQHKLDLGRKSLEDFRAYYSKNFPGTTAASEALYLELLGRIECEEGKADSAELHLKRNGSAYP